MELPSQYEVVWIIPALLEDAEGLPDSENLELEEIKEICKTKGIKAILCDNEGCVVGGISSSGEHHNSVFLS